MRLVALKLEPLDSLDSSSSYRSFNVNGVLAEGDLDYLLAIAEKLLHISLERGDPHVVMFIVRGTKVEGFLELMNEDRIEIRTNGVMDKLRRSIEEVLRRWGFS